VTDATGQTDGHTDGGLAQQAAVWVPPWARDTADGETIALDDSAGQASDHAAETGTALDAATADDLAAASASVGEPVTEPSAELDEAELDKDVSDTVESESRVVEPAEEAESVFRPTEPDVGDESATPDSAPPGYDSGEATPVPSDLRSTFMALRQAEGSSPNLAAAAEAALNARLEAAARPVVEEPITFEESAPVEERIVAEEPIPADESPAVEPTLIDEPAPVDEVIPVEEPIAVEEPSADEWFAAMPEVVAEAADEVAETLDEIAAADEVAETLDEPELVDAEPDQPLVPDDQVQDEPLATGLAIAPTALSEAELVPTLEAILMVIDEPVSEILLSQVLEVPAERIAGVLIDLSTSYTAQGRGFDLRRAAGGWRFYTRPEYSVQVEKFVLDGQQLRLSQSSLETLAVVAYKQPVTRSRISAIRGVNCDGVIRTLITRGMIEECGSDPESGAHLYRTTTLFLEKLGLDAVDQLPSLAPFLPDNVEEIADEQR
jgi:segregation and condensation protein B